MTRTTRRSSKSARLNWTPEKVAEILDWQKKNNSTVAEAASKFGLHPGVLRSAMYRMGKRAGGKATVNKQPKFIDITPAPLTTAPLAVVFCSPDQLSNVLRGLK